MKQFRFLFYILSLTLIMISCEEKEDLTPDSVDLIFNPDLTYDSITDVENNTYKTIIIGNQKWMAENLKTTTYNDGTPIPLETDVTAWARLTTPAYS